MATKADFTEAEWEQLRKGATGAGLLVSVSDRSFSSPPSALIALSRMAVASPASAARAGAPVPDTKAVNPAHISVPAIFVRARELRLFMLVFPFYSVSLRSTAYHRLA